MLSLKQLSVLANVLLEAYGIQDAEKLPEPSSILVLDGFTTEEDDSEDLFPRKYKVVACKKKTFKEYFEYETIPRRSQIYCPSQTSLPK